MSTETTPRRRASFTLASFVCLSRLVCVSRLACLSCLIVAESHAQGLAPESLRALDAREPITYFIAEGTAESGFRAADRELAEWALEAWERAAGGALVLEPGAEATALLRVYFVPASAGQYGEMRPMRVDGRRGAAVFVRPDTEALGPDIARSAREDELLRETIVYLTCLHEIGHALGLEHTAEHADIMYFFGYGGDIRRFFGRYREQLRARGDIAGVAGLSDGDLAQLDALYGPGSAAAGEGPHP